MEIALMTGSEHSLEALHRGRDAIATAVSWQAKTLQPSLDELHAFGSAIVSTLSQLGQLSSVLARQVGSFDDQELERRKLSDDPVDKLKAAGTHMSRLSDGLAEAVRDAYRYWSAMESVDLHTPPDFRTRRTDDE
ncbi:hypothetical protein AB0I53_24605 [Saccharopolyspora sp. NPDC050389]|uniref:hypothetical protein n=1 Tax=Saccharopolyspora sp. NPDC050389 TaxID=3155516 RepID=UPI0033D7A50D